MRLRLRLQPFVAVECKTAFVRSRRYGSAGEYIGLGLHYLLFGLTIGFAVAVTVFRCAVRTIFPDIPGLPTFVFALVNVFAFSWHFDFLLYII